MTEESATKETDAYFTLSGDVNSDMVYRVFEAVANMTEKGIDTAHLLVQSNGGYVSDGLCLYNFLANSPIKFVMYNGGAVASIAVILFLAGKQRFASETARFMVHKSHATASPGARPDALNIIVEGLRADDARTESILRKHVTLTPEQWAVHQYSDLHLTATDAKTAGMVEAIADFAPPKGFHLTNI
ncbi:ATP-dependent Clp protease proteolytic subunit [Massilia cavernae]|uniref:Peptidase S14 n=1 Tax=Massilia cavernae TaxID=2320864 RepID=A0A418XQA2_9BURK|nr:ATP-dependent Clp protease proteolytic subunit [Massilia cavernae]RJG14682.1 peptidase S14 [Massilia cavernae]